MKIEYEKGKVVEVETFVKNELDGADYEQGRLEGLEGVVDNLCWSFGRLLSLLAEKDLLSARQAANVVGRHWFGARSRKSSEPFEPRLIKEE